VVDAYNGNLQGAEEVRVPIEEILGPAGVRSAGEGLRIEAPPTFLGAYPPEALKNIQAVNSYYYFTVQAQGDKVDLQAMTSVEVYYEEKVQPKPEPQPERKPPTQQQPQPKEEEKETPVEVKMQIQTRQALEATGPKEVEEGELVTYSWKTTPQGENPIPVLGYLAYVQVARDGELWIRAPNAKGKTITIDGKEYTIESDWIGVVRGNEVVLYVDGDKIVGYPTEQEIKIDGITPYSEEELIKLNELLGGVFYTKDTNWTVEGTGERMALWVMGLGPSNIPATNVDTVVTDVVKPQPTQEVSPPQQEVKEAPPQVTHISTQLHAPPVIVLGEGKYDVKVEFSDVVDKGILFGVEELKDGGAYLYITNPQEVVFKVGEHELRVDPSKVRNLGRYEDGKLYIYYKDGEVVDASVGSDQVLEIEIGQTPEEWKDKLPEELLTLFSKDNVKEAVFEVDPATGVRVRWIALGVKEGAEVEKVEQVSEYATIMVKSEVQSIRLKQEQDKVDAPPHSIEVKALVGEQEKPVVELEATAIAIWRPDPEKHPELAFVLNREGKIVGMEVPIEGETYYYIFNTADDPNNWKAYIALQDVLQEKAEERGIEAYKDQLYTWEEFVEAVTKKAQEIEENNGNGKALIPFLEPTIEDGKATVDIQGELPVVGERMVIEYRWMVKGRSEEMDRMAEKKAIGEQIFLAPKALLPPAEEYQDPFQVSTFITEEEETSNNYQGLAGVYERTRSFLAEDFLPKEDEEDDEKREFIERLNQSFLKYWPLLEEGALTDEKLKEISEAWRTIASIPLRAEYERTNEKSLYRVLFGEGEETFNLATLLGVDQPTLGDLIAYVASNKDAILDWLSDPDNAEALYTGQAPSEVKAAILLMLILNTQANNTEVNYIPRYVDMKTAMSTLYDTMADLLPVVEYMQLSSENPEAFKDNAVLNSYKNAVENLKSDYYWELAINSTELIEAIYDPEAIIQVETQTTRVVIRERDLIQLGIDWKIWERMSEEERASVVLRLVNTIFMRETQTTTRVEKTGEEGPIVEEETTTAVGFGTKTRFGVKAEYQTPTDNILAEVYVGGKIYVVEIKEGNVSFFPTGLLEEVRLVGSATYTRKVIETEDMRVSVWTRLSGEWLKDLKEGDEVYFFQGRVGIVAEFERMEDGKYRFRIKGAYEWDLRDGEWKRKHEVEGSMILSPIGNTLSVSCQGDAGEICGRISASYIHPFSSNATLKITGFIEGDNYGIAVGVRFAF